MRAKRDLTRPDFDVCKADDWDALEGEQPVTGATMPKIMLTFIGWLADRNYEPYEGTAVPLHT